MNPQDSERAGWKSAPVAHGQLFLDETIYWDLLKLEGSEYKNGVSAVVVSVTVDKLTPQDFTIAN